MNDKMAEMYKNEAIQTIRLFASDEEFIKQMFASLHVSSENMTIRRIALDGYLDLDTATPTLSDLPTME